MRPIGTYFIAVKISRNKVGERKCVSISRFDGALREEGKHPKMHPQGNLTACKIVFVTSLSVCPSATFASDVWPQETEVSAALPFFVEIVATPTFRPWVQNGREEVLSALWPCAPFPNNGCGNCFANQNVVRPFSSVFLIRHPFFVFQKSILRVFQRGFLGARWAMENVEVLGRMGVVKIDYVLLKHTKTNTTTFYKSNKHFIICMFYSVVFCFVVVDVVESKM